MGRQKSGVLTARQQELLKAIKDYQTEYGTIPSLVELGAKMNITISGVAQKINALERKGVLVRRNIYEILEFPKPCVLPKDKVENRNANEGMGIPLK